MCILHPWRGGGGDAFELNYFSEPCYMGVRPNQLNALHIFCGEPVFPWLRFLTTRASSWGLRPDHSDFSSCSLPGVTIATLRILFAC